MYFNKSLMKYFKRYDSPLSMYEKIKSIIKKKIYPND